MLKIRGSLYQGGSLVVILFHRRKFRFCRVSGALNCISCRRVLVLHPTSALCWHQWNMNVIFDWKQCSIILITSNMMPALWWRFETPNCVVRLLFVTIALEINRSYTPGRKMARNMIRYITPDNQLDDIGKTVHDQLSKPFVKGHLGKVA